jgi:NADH-quinone oxidoreductase subunit H
VWHLPHGIVVLLQFLAFGAKVVLLSMFQLLIRWTLPRFRADQLMNLGWKLLLPLSLANIMVTALIKLIFMGS